MKNVNEINRNLQESIAAKTLKKSACADLGIGRSLPSRYLSWARTALHRSSGFIRLLTMISDVRRLLLATPFEPFVVATTAGCQYRVPIADHAGLHPNGGRMVIWFDDDSSVTVSGLHIAAIEKERPRKNEV